MTENAKNINEDTASVKCIYQKEARVLRFKKEVNYENFIHQISQEFGLPLVVDQYVDAEGTLIKLGESSILDLSAQFNYRTEVRKSLYDLTVYMREATTISPEYVILKNGRENSKEKIIRSNSNKVIFYSPRSRTQSTSKSSPRFVNFNIENTRRNSNPDYRINSSHDNQMSDDFNNRRISESALKFVYVGDSDEDFDDIDDEIVMNDVSWSSDMFTASGKTPPKDDISPLDDRNFSFSNDKFSHNIGKDDVDYSHSLKRMEGLTITVPQNILLNEGFNSDGSFEFPPSGDSSSALRTPTFAPSSFSPQLKTFIDMDENNVEKNIIDLPTFHQQPFPTKDIYIPNEPVVNEVSEQKDTPRTKKKKNGKRPRKGSKSSRDKNKGTKENQYTKENSIGSELPFKWKKGDLIGKGAFGNVYKGLLSTGQFVAVKHLELPPDIIPEKNSHFKSFIKEIELLRGLNHPNIVRYIGSSVEQNNVYVFLEYVSGGSISSIINKYGHLEEETIKTFAKQILVALAYLHENKIAHRDIKGANILIDSEGNVKLADFGCSKMMELKSATGENFETLLGTPFWMAPEVMTQQGHGRKADIWSFGCTLIEMATGTPPWASQYTQVAALLFDIATSQKIPELPEHVSNEMKDLLTLCLNRNAQERPNASELLCHPWFSGESIKVVRKNVNKKKALHSLLDLPSNMLIHIFQYLDLKDIHAMSQLCTFFRDFVNRPSVWQNMSLTQWPKLKRYHSLRGESLGESLINTSDKLSHWQKLYIVGTQYDNQIRKKTEFNQVMTIKGHSKSINNIQIIDNFTKLITCSSDKKIKIWDIDRSPQTKSEKSKKPKVSITFRGHTQAVNCFTLIDNTLISGSSDKTLRIWDIRSEKSSTILKSHNSSITCLSSCSSSHKFASTSNDFMVKLWDINTTTLLHTFNPHEKTIKDAKINNNVLVTASVDGTLKAWDLRSLNLIKTFKGHSGPVNHIDILGDTILSGSSDGLVKEWSLGQDKCKSTFNCFNQKGNKTTEIITLSFDSFNTITVLNSNGDIIFIDYNKEQLISQHKVDSGTHLFDRKGSVIATCGNDKLAKIWILKEP